MHSNFLNNGDKVLTSGSGGMGFHWYYLDSQYRFEIMDRLVPDRVEIEGIDTEDLHAQVFVERGCVHSLKLRNGRLVACADTTALLASGSFDLLGAWLAAYEVPFDRAS